MDSITNHPIVLTILIALPVFGVLAKLFGATLERIARWYLYIAVFAVVIVMDSMFFPFIGGKDYFFRFTVELSLIFFLLAWAFEMHAGELAERLRNFYKRPLAIAVTAFFIAFMLACVFAYDIHAAFWSNYERGEGGFQMIHYYLFFVLLALLLRNEKEWKNIFRYSLVAAGLMILYGIGGSLMLQSFIGPWSGSSSIPSGAWAKLIGNRFQGSLGNAEYVGAYLLFTMFFTLYLWIKRKASGAMKFVDHVPFIILIIVFTFFFALSQTRGALLGLCAGILAVIIYFIVSGRGKARAWASGLLILFILASGATFVFRNTKTVSEIPVVGHILKINLNDSDVQSRFIVWNEAWKGFLERPVFGWGPENFTTVFDKFFNPSLFSPTNGGQTWFDRAHSVFFDYLSETGIIGLLAYVSIFVLFFVEFRRRRGEISHTPRAVFERSIILAMSIAYLVQGIPLFDVLPTYVSLFTFLAFAFYYFYGHSPVHHGDHGGNHGSHISDHAAHHHHEGGAIHENGAAVHDNA